MARASDFRGRMAGGGDRNGMPVSGGYRYRGLGYDLLAPLPDPRGTCDDCGHYRTSNVHRAECLGLPRKTRPDVAERNRG